MSPSYCFLERRGIIAIRAPCTVARECHNNHNPVTLSVAKKVIFDHAGQSDLCNSSCSSDRTLFVHIAVPECVLQVWWGTPSALCSDGRFQKECEQFKAPYLDSAFASQIWTFSVRCAESAPRDLHRRCRESLRLSPLVAFGRHTIQDERAFFFRAPVRRQQNDGLLLCQKSPCDTTARCSYTCSAGNAQQCRRSVGTESRWGWDRFRYFGRWIRTCGDIPGG
jgi:hypothetical protein